MDTPDALISQSALPLTTKPKSNIACKGDPKAQNGVRIFGSLAIMTHKRARYFKVRRNVIIIN